MNDIHFSFKDSEGLQSLLHLGPIIINPNLDLQLSFCIMLIVTNYAY